MTWQQIIRHFPGFIFLLLLIPIIILDLWAVIEISKTSYKNRDQKRLWTNVVLLFPVVGLFVYLFYGRKKLKGLNP